MRNIRLILYYFLTKRNRATLTETLFNHMNTLLRPPVMIIVVFSEVFFSHLHAAVRSVSGVGFSGDTTVLLAVWVYFTDKPYYNSTPSAISQRAFARRKAVRFRSPPEADYPVSLGYLQRIETLGGKLRHCFKWENVASFDLPAAAVPAVKALPFVKNITLVGGFRKAVEKQSFHFCKRKTSAYQGIYGGAYDQLAIINIPGAHEYISYTCGDAPGQGVRIAFFDSGFRLRHRCFRHLFERNAVVAAFDFVDKDTTVEDPDSVFNNLRHPYYRNDEHGTLVFSLVAAYDPPYYCGAAWGADFLLARTEDGYMYDEQRSREVHAEEDNWAAAVVWAESIGVDVISSSVAYREGFEDTVVIDLGNGVFDTIVSYDKSHLDGKTTIVSRAAKGAVERGVIVVCSVGNEGYEGDTSLNAPADVDGVISVGMVDMFGLLDAWSSRGPTSDGRKKPDLVAPGSGVLMPEVYSYQSTDTYILQSGTSFSAPFVSAICALVKQSSPSLDAAAVREHLYRFCRRKYGGVEIDYGYGRGIPDALLSCMKSDEVFLTAKDSSGIPLKNAFIAKSNGSDTIARFDDSGRALFRLQDDNKIDIEVFKDDNRRRISIDSTPCRKLLLPCTLVIYIKNEKFKPLQGASVGGVIGTQKFIRQTDSTGRVLIENFFTLPVKFAASKEAYRSSDTMYVLLQEMKQERAIQLFPVSETALTLFPTVIHINREGALHIRYSSQLNSGVKTLRFTVRAISGDLIHHENYMLDTPKGEFIWNCRGADGHYAAPGAYIVTVVFEGKTLRRKIIITP